MSEHTPLTEAAEVLHDAGWYGRADLTTAQLDGILLTLFNADWLAARTSTATADTGHKAGCQEYPTGWLCVSDCTTVWHDKATADTGLRERVEAWLRRYDLGAAETRPAVLDLRAALDAAPASTEDRADNEGTPE